MLDSSAVVACCASTNVICTLVGFTKAPTAQLRDRAVPVLWRPVDYVVRASTLLDMIDPRTLPR
jgi:hypothetical protein